MPSFPDYLEEYSKSRGVTDADKERYQQQMGPPMDKTYPKSGSGKPTEHPKMYYKAPKKQ